MSHPLPCLYSSYAAAASALLIPVACLLGGCDPKPSPTTQPSASQTVVANASAPSPSATGVRPALSILRMPTAAAATSIQMMAKPYAVGERRRIVRDVTQNLTFERAGKKNINRLSVHEERIDTITAVTDGVETGIAVEFVDHRIERQRGTGPRTSAESQVKGQSFRLELADKKISMYRGASGSKELVSETFHRPLRRRFARFGKAKFALTKSEEHRIGARFEPAEAIAVDLIAPALAADIFQGRVTIDKLVVSGLREQPDYVDLAVSVKATLIEPMLSRTNMVLQGTMRMMRKTGRPVSLRMAGETVLATSQNSPLGSSKGTGETRITLRIEDVLPTETSGDKTKTPPTQK